MNRSRFIGAAAAATLAGCSGHGAGVLPVAAPSNTKTAPATYVGFGEMRLTDQELAHPIIGEVSSFVGTTPPAGWEFATGQVVPITQNRPLFSILGQSAGGDGKTTFAYPNPKFGGQWIVAVAGTFPSSPAVLANTGLVLYGKTLGKGQSPAPLKPPAPPPAELLAAQALVESQIHVGTARPEPLDRGLADRIAASEANARVASQAALSRESAARLASLVDDAVAGRRDLGSMLRELSASLSPSEAKSLLAINDAVDVQFRGSSGAHADLQSEAAHFLVSVAFTPDQLDAMMERSNP